MGCAAAGWGGLAKGGNDVLSEQRGPMTILADLLEATQDADRKTAILRSAGLNHTRGTRYLESSLELGLVEVEDGCYALTADGRRFLDHWAEIEALVGPT